MTSPRRAGGGTLEHPGGWASGCPPALRLCPGAELRGSQGPAARSLSDQVRRACSAAASAAPALGCQPASSWGDIRPAPRPLPTSGDSWTLGWRVGAGKPAPKETPAPGEGRGAGRLPRLSAGSSERTARGEEETGWAGASEGIFLSRLESEAGGSVLPRSLPGDGNLLHFPGAGSPTLPTSPPCTPPPGSPGPSSFRAPHPAGQDPGHAATPSSGKGSRRHLGAGAGGWGLPRSRGSVVQHVRLM